jgi:hypothetical protein
MTAPRESILTTITPADRIPSHGTQLSADRSADVTSTGLRIDNRTITDDLNARAAYIDRTHGPATYCVPSCSRCAPCPRCGFIGAGHVHSAAPAPVALNLWDTSADSIPETWSL